MKHTEDSEELCLSDRSDTNSRTDPCWPLFSFASRANFLPLSCSVLTGGAGWMSQVRQSPPTVGTVDQTGVRGAETKGSRLSAAIRPQSGWQSSALGSLIGSCASPPPPFLHVGEPAYRSIDWDAILFEGRISHLIVSSSVIAASKSQPLYFWRACWRPVGFGFFSLSLSRSRSLSASQRCRCVRVIRPAGFCRAHKTAPVPNACDLMQQ